MRDTKLLLGQTKVSFLSPVGGPLWSSPLGGVRQACTREVPFGNLSILVIKYLIANSAPSRRSFSHCLSHFQADSVGRAPHTGVFLANWVIP